MGKRSCKISVLARERVHESLVLLIDNEDRLFMVSNIGCRLLCEITPGTPMETTGTACTIALIFFILMGNLKLKENITKIYNIEPDNDY